VTTIAWFASFLCGCTESQPDLTDIPEVCPGHHQAQEDEPEHLRAFHGRIEVGHRCYDEQCA
jgi:hypothetical protein